MRELLRDRYAVEREVARGGASLVYFARDLEGRPVAVKVLHPQLAVTVTADRFLREIAMLSRLQHPRVAKLIDYGEREFLVYYVMLFIEGPSLKQHLLRARRASVSDAIRIATDLLDALGFAHGHGIVHRDVKPDNIILSPEGAMLLDFGIARAIEAAAGGEERLTKSGFTVGTSFYMSPEQVGGADDIDYRTDVYSLGCVLFEALAGRPPFSHRNEAVVLNLHRTEPPPDLRELRPEVSPELAAVIHRALAKERDERWPSAEAMRQAVLDCRAAIET